MFSRPLLSTFNDSPSPSIHTAMNTMKKMAKRSFSTSFSLSSSFSRNGPSLLSPSLSTLTSHSFPMNSHFSSSFSSSPSSSPPSSPSSSSASSLSSPSHPPPSLSSAPHNLSPSSSSPFSSAPDTIPAPPSLSHHTPSYHPSTSDDYTMVHPIWDHHHASSLRQTHRTPLTLMDSIAATVVKLIRFNFDWMTGYGWLPLTEERALRRILFLETVAGIPGSIAGTLRHLASLRNMRRDGGWIHSLLQEAENERFHMLTFLALYQPSPFMRGMVFLSQGIFYNFFFLAYLVSPKFCHRLVGYLEEEAVHTYTAMIKSVDEGKLSKWADGSVKVPLFAQKYWELNDKSTIRDLLVMVRADEAHHRDANHLFGDLKKDQLNPFKPGHADPFIEEVKIGDNGKVKIEGEKK